MGPDPKSLEVTGNLGALTLLISVGVRAGLGLLFSVCDLPDLKKMQVHGLPFH